jgi:hypothetical protein
MGKFLDLFVRQPSETESVVFHFEWMKASFQVEIMEFKCGNYRDNWR